MNSRWMAVLAFLFLTSCLAGENFRPFKNDADARAWLEIMVAHRFTPEEIRAAAGTVPAARVEAPQRPGDRLFVVPYPGGRHPRIGFLDGAVDPQRETKVSVFTPWDTNSYVVADIPEAIWSNLGLTYLAHTHVPTVWSRQNIELPRLEWERLASGDLRMERTLPNGIGFGTVVHAEKEGVRMRQWLRNGTKEKLTDLRVQNCVMLKGAEGFAAQTNANKIFSPPYCAVKSPEGKRWIITGWAPIHRCWGNAPCPCLHADPKFPDCEPGATVEVRGWLSFYEGEAIEQELRRLDGINWK